MFARIATSVCTARTSFLRWFRPSSGAVIGVLALLMQMLPALASTEDGIWIEICSDLGPVMMQIDASETPVRDAPACPECEDCTLCATGLSSLPDQTNRVQLKAPAHRIDGYPILTNTRVLPRHLRPVTRGPPSGTPQSAAQLPRLSPASSNLNGGAPWT